MSVRLLRCELLEMQARLIDRLSRRVEGGDLALLGSVTGAMAALERLPMLPADGHDLEEFTCARATVATYANGIAVAFYGRGADLVGQGCAADHRAATFLADFASVLAPQLGAERPPQPRSLARDAS